MVSWALPVPGGIIEAVPRPEAGPGVGDSIEGCWMATHRLLVPGLGAWMETLVLNQVTKTGEKKRLRDLVLGAWTWGLRAGPWGPRAAVKWLPGAIPAGFPQTLCLWRPPGRGPLPKTCWSLTFSPSVPAKADARSPPHALPPACASALGAWCLCSGDSPGQRPGLMSGSCTKHHRRPRQSRMGRGEADESPRFPSTPLLDPLPES